MTEATTLTHNAPIQANSKVQSFPGAPTFAMIVAERVTNPYQDMDCIILITGRKRSGKSTQAVALAEEISEWIAYFRNEVDLEGKLNAKKFFDISTNIISVSRMGGLGLLTSPRITQTNNVFVIDDAKINLSNRKFNTPENQLQNDIATIVGPFRLVLIYTMVFKKTIDLGTRELADYIIQIRSSNAFTKQTFGKIYFFETSDDGIEYKKYLRWRNPTTGITYRIKDWIGTLPTHESLLAYNNMRRYGSVQLIEEARAQYEGISKKKAEVRLSRSELRKIWIKNNRLEVQNRKASGDSIRKISRDMSQPVSTIETCLMKEIA
ncbi:MAG: hypothetical protein M0Q91_05590 [Methanoregula sp.]|nr:hypothetical protein [Methanoregula sp.]